MIIDGADHMHGMKALSDSIPPLLGGRKPVMLVGMLRDKDFADALGVIAPLAEKMVTVTVDNPRTSSAEETAQAARNGGCRYVQPVSSDWKNGLTWAMRLAEDEERALIICGSLYLAADCRAQLQRMGD